MTQSPPEVAPVRLEPYWIVSARPLPSLLFIAPMLAIYELGVILLGANAIRNGADAWMRVWLEMLGFSQYFLLPVLTCGALLAAHHLGRSPWYVGRRTLVYMWLEATLFAVVLLALAQAQAHWFINEPLSIPADIGGGRFQFLAEVIGYFGAGIYEELLFRLLLLPAVLGMLRAAGVSRHVALVSAVVLTSLIFSAAHYRLDLMLGPWHITTRGETFAWFSFFFRFSAGAFFATLFHYRGFGITAGSHALYDVFTKLV